MQRLPAGGDAGENTAVRNRFRNLLAIREYLGVLFWILGIALLLPLIPLIAYARQGRTGTTPLAYAAPAVAAVVLGFVLKSWREFKPLNAASSMLLCSVSWILLSALGAVPFCIALPGVSYLDAYFETVSGFTTTGITMLQGLDSMPRCILFWRSFIQWVGGLGILTFFLAVISAGASAQRLYSAESHKIFSKRPAPGLFHTLRILWSIYAGFTVLIAVLLKLEGLGVYDAVSHALTCLSTGGYSPYDASIDHFRQAGYAHFVAIEYTIIFGMMLGGTNFFIHYRLLRGSGRALWDSLEVKLWWGLLAGATLLVALVAGLDERATSGAVNIGGTIRHSLFQVVALATTTGYATRDVTSYPALAKQVFLLLMIIGGCVGSTGGGIKVMRIAVLLKMVGRQLRRVVHGAAAVSPVVVDGERIDPEEIRRVSALFFAWLVFLVVGSGITALLSNFGALESASGMFSALGNIGPCYISVDAITALHPVVKITYIIGMLAGRLEILPVLLLFSRRAWM